MEETRRQRTPRRDPRLGALAEESGYRIEERIGAGGMGIVYRAHDADGREVAIKLLRHDIADDPRARERLAREVAAQKLVRSESIVRILDAELDSPDAFVVTEFVPGPTLEDAVRERGGLHPEAVREVGLVLGDALRVIHAAGVIHRDLKPSNVLLRGARPRDLDGFDPEGDRLDPVIIDFGIAIAAEESRLTSTGLVMGTAAYLDPEVVRTNHTAEAGDWWSLAAMLAYAATGREPYGSGRADLVFLRADRGEIDVDGLPVELAAWLREALQADPARRPDPATHLAKLADLDLTRFEDAGETEAFGADGRTAVLPAGAAAAGAAAATPSEAPGDEAASGEGGDGATTVLPVADDGADADADADAADDPATGAGAPGPEATQVLPVVADGDRTETLPRIDDAGATRAEAVREQPGGGYDAPTEAPRTEALPVVESPTMRLPVIQEELAAPPRPVPTPTPSGNDPRSHDPQRPVQRGPDGGLAGYPVTAPVASPYPAQTSAPSPYPAPQPYGQMAPYGMAPQPVPPPPRRPVLVWLGHLLLIGLGVIAPYIALVLLLLLGGAARTWERSHRSVAARRMRGSSGAGPLWAAGTAAPFRFLQGVAETALQAVLPLLLGLLVGVAVDAATYLGTGTALPDGVALGTAVGITTLLTWVGIGSRTTRLGAHRMVDAAAPDRTWTAVLLGLLLLLLVAVVATIGARQGMVDYFPFSSGPTLESIAFWRR
ncbi:serine/threonine-protein kinase [Brachybacterium horti]